MDSGFNQFRVVDIVEIEIDSASEGNEAIFRLFLEARNANDRGCLGEFLTLEGLPSNLPLRRVTP
jgi:hypothetical protein